MTVLTLAGAVGIGPGAAAQASSPEPGGGSNAPPARSAGQTPADAATSNSNGDGWLTVQRTPDRPSQPTSSPSGPASNPDAAAVDVPARSGHGTRIVYDVSSQRIWLVNRHDVVVRTYLASGDESAKVPVPGRYRVTSRSRHSASATGRETSNYLVRFGHGRQSGGAFSDIPARRDGTLTESQTQLGTAVSTDTIRQWITDAKALWEFASVGTPVVVTA